MNRRPSACKADALPTELHPQGIDTLACRFELGKMTNRRNSKLSVGVPELESGTSSLSATRSNQLSYTPVLNKHGQGGSHQAFLTHVSVDRERKVYGNSVCCQREEWKDSQLLVKSHTRLSFLKRHKPAFTSAKKGKCRTFLTVIVQKRTIRSNLAR